MKPQIFIEKIESDNKTAFLIHKEEQGKTEKLEQSFDSYQQALDFILSQGWQLKRDNTGSLHVETRFLKP